MDRRGRLFCISTAALMTNMGDFQKNEDFV
jgi:hypothetical protein